MLIASILFFVIAAAGGIFLATMSFQHNPMSPCLAMTHGGLAATGVVLLIIAMAVGAKCGVMLTTALILFIFAAIGGVTMAAAFSMRKITIPMSLMLGHGALAVVALILLLVRVITT
jgi:hypothetical protein